jgi:hypothetical protein
MRCGRVLAIAFVVAACEDDAVVRPAPVTLSRRGYSFVVSSAGDVVGATDASSGSWLRDGDNLVRITIGDGEPIACDTPSNVGLNGDALVFEYDLRPRAPVLVRAQISLVDALDGVALRREIAVTPAPTAAGVMISVGDVVGPREASIFIPHQDGFGEESPAAARSFLYALGKQSGDAERLAVPMISESDHAGRRVTHVTDVTFGATFDRDHVAWTYSLPLESTESRVVYDVLHTGSPMDALYATVLADTPPGPAWLHDIAWQHYDYMSHGGQGWFDDLDALTAALTSEDRARVMFTLHGWFDVYGHYAFDAASRRLLDRWTVFPNAANVADRFPDLVTMPMTKAEIHRRIAYAKSRGFRVGFYFADGTATGEDVVDLFRRDRALYQGGWQGPDTTSPTWVLDPSHPDVAAFFRDYLDALLAEYGNEIDALVWDETFLVRSGMAGVSYADRSMMRLVHDLARRVSAFRADLALLASDDIGVEHADGTRMTDVPPYALAAHGTYQDSASQPGAWRWGLFPNLRNTLWSCNWASQTHFDDTRYGVEQFNAPVATSNGFIDNVGFARLDQASRDRLLALFAARKSLGRQELHWLTAP